MSVEAGELVARARALALAGEFGLEAEQINRRILDLVPGDVGSMTRLAKCLVARGDHVEAEAIYQGVLEIDRDNNIARNALNGLRPILSDSDTETAVRHRAARFSDTAYRAVRPEWRPRRIEVVIPNEDAARFGDEMQQPLFWLRERRYKWAVHLVMAALLSQPNRDSENLAVLISDVLGTAKPNLAALGLDEDAQREARECGLRGAISNLCGGRFGHRQFDWIADAVHRGHGTPIAEAFRKLVDDSIPLARRVDDFRSDLNFVAQEYMRTGGAVNQGDIQVSLAFAAVILGGFDPTRYTFYMASSLQRGYEYYAPGLTWPRGCSVGERYEDVCSFVKSVEQQLMKCGLPVRDLIDAQSFLWMRYRPHRSAWVRG